MASLTIRKLDERLKQRLRILAAANGRSVEEEIRQILKSAAAADHRQPISAVPVEPVLSHRAPRPRSAQAEVSALEPSGRRVLLIIGGGIAAYKSLDLIRRLRDRGMRVGCILTAAAQEFITALSAGALSGERVFTDLFDAASEFDVGHIRLARETDLVVVAPATADLMAKMASGQAGDLACAVLLATDKPVLIAPAMNPHMWSHSATQRNLARLAADGIAVVGPNAGEMAEPGEVGIGRMAEPLEIVVAVEAMLGPTGDGPLAGKRVLVTSGPTHEPIDPVRYIANRSSGKQGHAIAAAAAAAGADVNLISGPVHVADPPGVRITKVESAREMLAAVEEALPVDCAIFAAAVADWRVADASPEKIKKTKSAPGRLVLVENPDILSAVAHDRSKRPQLVIGFAAETENVVANAREKLLRKGCDWIVANDVSPETGIMGGDRNSVHLITREAVEAWPPQSKEEVAATMVRRIAAALGGESP